MNHETFDDFPDVESRPLPDQIGWDLEETREFSLVRREIDAMRALPVEVRCCQPGRDREASWHGTLEVEIEEADALTLGLAEAGLAVKLAAANLLGAELTPGFVRAYYPDRDLSVSRVSLVWWSRRRRAPAA